MNKGSFRLFPLLTIIFLVAIGCSRKTHEAGTSQVDFSAAQRLLEVLKADVDACPEYHAVALRLSSLSGEQHDSLLDSLIAAKKSNPELVRNIDDLLESPAYQLYYRQFRNVTPDIHRRILLALPYEAVPSPAGISQNLLEITNYLQFVQRWTEGLSSRIDLDTCRRIAMRWLPSGNYELPKTYFIFDGNGDAFARDGQVCFDLYSLVLGRLSPASGYESLDTVSLDRVERVLAHEFHHIFARTYFVPSPDESADWKTRWRNRLVRQMALEGTAMHCNPPEGFARVIKEDTVVVVHWIRELDRELRAVENSEVTEEAASAWLDSTYQESARRVLRQYLSRTIQGAELEREVQAHSIDRPSLIYTLGWWMVSHISGQGSDPEAVHDLIRQPLSLFERYNATIKQAADSLRVSL